MTEENLINLISRMSNNKIRNTSNLLRHYQLAIWAVEQARKQQSVPLDSEPLYFYHLLPALRNQTTPLLKHNMKLIARLILRST